MLLALSSCSGLVSLALESQAQIVKKNKREKKEVNLLGHVSIITT
jgi:hypothetical protein